MIKTVLFIVVGFILMMGIAAAGECNHEWVAGPFYITVASSYEEPNFYPPSAVIQIEHCKKCGLLRLQKELRGYTGENLAAGSTTTENTPVNDATNRKE